MITDDNRRYASTLVSSTVENTEAVAREVSLHQDSSDDGGVGGVSPQLFQYMKYILPQN